MCLVFSVSSSKTVTVLARATACYRFLSEESVAEALRALKKHPSGVCPKGEVYYDGGGSYYLLLEEIGKCDNTPELPLILEFGDRLNGDAPIFVSEHFTRIADCPLIQ